jgi:hypothetical protein
MITREIVDWALREADRFDTVFSERLEDSKVDDAWRGVLMTWGALGVEQGAFDGVYESLPVAWRTAPTTEIEDDALVAYLQGLMIGVLAARREAAEREE